MKSLAVYYNRIKAIIRFIILYSIALLKLMSFLALSRLKSNTNVKKYTAMVVYTSRPGSLGDDALVTVSVLRLLEMGKEVLLAETNIRHRWPSLEGKKYTRYKIASVDCHEPVQNIKNILDRLKLGNLLKPGADIFFIGADVLDGAYSLKGSINRLNIISWFSKAGFPVTVLGTSINPNVPVLISRKIKALSPVIRFCLRDPVSLRRYHKIAGRNGILTADIAFLLSPDPVESLSADFRDFIVSERGQGRKILALNCSSHTFIGLNNDERNKAFNSIALALIQKIQQGLAVVYIPHDFRSFVVENDLVIGQKIKERLPADIADHYHLISEATHASQIKAMVSQTDFALTGRMHLAIAALGSCIPTACVVYQGKFEGLFEHFEIKGLSIEGLQLIIPGAFQSLLEELISRHEKLISPLRLKLPQVLKYARLNFV